MGDYTITLPDGTEISGDSHFDVLSMAIALENERNATDTDTLPTATLGEEDITLQDCVDSWERKAVSTNYSNEARATYTHCAEKLQTVIDEGVLAESP